MLVAVQKKIKALRDMRLKTSIDDRRLVAGEVAIISFINEVHFQQLMGTGGFIAAGPSDAIKKNIPIIGTKPTPKVW